MARIARVVAPELGKIENWCADGMRGCSKWSSPSHRPDEILLSRWWYTWLKMLALSRRQGGRRLSLVLVNSPVHRGRTQGVTQPGVVDS